MHETVSHTQNYAYSGKEKETVTDSFISGKKHVIRGTRKSMMARKADVKGANKRRNFLRIEGIFAKKVQSNH